MNTKLITALLAFFTAFGLSSAFTSFINKPNYSTIYTDKASSSESRKIANFLRQDIRNGERRLDSFTYSGYAEVPFTEKSLAIYAEAVENYADESGDMDDSNLPSDLQSAWREHMKAWRELSDVLNDETLKVGNDEDELDAVQTYFENESKIDETWYKVLNIAHKYNACPYHNR